MKTDNKWVVYFILCITVFFGIWVYNFIYDRVELNKDRQKAEVLINNSRYALPEYANQLQKYLESLKKENKVAYLKVIRTYNSINVINPEDIEEKCASTEAVACTTSVSPKSLSSLPHEAAHLIWYKKTTIGKLLDISIGMNPIINKSAGVKFFYSREKGMVHAVIETAADYNGNQNKYSHVKLSLTSDYPSSKTLDTWGEYIFKVILPYQVAAVMTSAHEINERYIGGSVLMNLWHMVLRLPKIFTGDFKSIWYGIENIWFSLGSDKSTLIFLFCFIIIGWKWSNIYEFALKSKYIVTKVKQDTKITDEIVHRVSNHLTMTPKQLRLNHLL